MSLIQKSYPSVLPIGRLVALVAVLASLTGIDLQAAQTPSASAIDAIFAEYDMPGSVGCALGVSLDGELVYKKGYGFANLDWDIPITSTTAFYVGSVAKQFTAAAIALLADEGKLDLDDDIRKYLPEMPMRDPAITIRQVVHHMSGLPGIWGVMQRNGTPTWDRFTPQQALDLLAQQELDFPPGERYSYSNGGYFSLAMIVEAASGKSLREYAAEKIFEPLGMTGTHFHDDPVHIISSRALSYQPRQDGDQGVEGRYYQSYQGNFAIPGPGGLYTTVEDMLQWERNFLDNQLGGSDFMEMMHTNGILNSGEVLNYAFGLREGERGGLRTVGHGGSYMGFQASYTRFPEQRFATFVLCNMGRIRPGPLGLQVADLFLAAQMTR
jgi:CubicO group peptidase (beta-lactamase class C family)